MTDQKKNQVTANHTTQTALASAEARRAALRKAGAGAVAKPSNADMLAKVGMKRPRLVFAFDATASRSAAWDNARKVTDTLFQALPGQLDVALAVHGGSKVHTFTEFTTNANKLRDEAAQIECIAGGACLIEIMERTCKAGDVKILLYIGDSFEEDENTAMMTANALKEQGIRFIVLEDGASADGSEKFRKLAGITDGFSLPFDMAAADKLRDVFEAIAVLAVGGVKLLETKKKTLVAAPLLLSHLSGKT